jgi:DNA excision repair protein ERCC-4
MVPTGMLPYYLSEAFGDLYEHDGLAVLGKGMGSLSLLASLVRYYADPEEGHQSAAIATNDASEDEPGNDPSVSSSLHKKPPLVFVLGMHREGERNALLNVLSSWGTPDEIMPTIVTNEAGQGKDRAALYRRGGLFVVTSRILIVDLLNHTVDSNDVDGFLVYHAEQVTKESTEAFILRIYHSQKQPFGSGFVKAVSHDPDQLLSGFANVDKILKALGVQKLYLYPRFHHHVRDELERRPPVVTELHQKLSPAQREMQSALAVAVQSCLRELKSALPNMVSWSTDPELSVENCVTSSFDRAVSRQLEPMWHSLAPPTKQLVQDLRTLRTLFQSLIQYDCVSFWNLLTNLKTASAQSRHPSLWLLTPAANALFKLAKARCYTIVKKDKASGTKSKSTTKALVEGSSNAPAAAVGRLVPKLELNPKWRLLEHVLDEIHDEYTAAKAKVNADDDSEFVVSVGDDDKRGANHVTAATGPTNVLVMVQDPRTLDALQSYLAEATVDGKASTKEGGRSASRTSRTLLLRWLRYLEGINDRSRARLVTATVASAVSATAGSAPSAATAATGDVAPAVRSVEGMPEEDRLLLEEEGRVRRILFGNKGGGNAGGGPRLSRKRPRNAVAWKVVEGDAPTTTAEPEASGTKLNQVPSYIKKRRRIAKEKARGEATLDDLEREAVLDDAVETAEHELSATGSDPRNSNTSKSTPAGEEELFQADSDDEAMFRVSYRNEFRIVLRSYASIEGDEASLLLQEVRPRYIVLYDTEMSFVRSIEIYSALRDANEPEVRVYFLMFEASAEEKNFMKSLEREQNAFERLIHHKKTMPPPAIQVHASQEMQQALLQGVGGVAGTYMGGLLPLSVDTRRGLGKSDTSKKPGDVAVDVREFRSALPSILHQGGMRLAPVTLTVGDFVLSNIHCVERKSISDLFGSFASGRLYTQAEAMCKYYKCPCLLIEFDPQKSFSLQNANELGSEIRTDSICR